MLATLSQGMRSVLEGRRPLLWATVGGALLVYMLGYMQGGLVDTIFADGGSRMVHEFFHHARHMGFPCH